MITVLSIMFATIVAYTVFSYFVGVDKARRLYITPPVVGVTVTLMHGKSDPASLLYGILAGITGFIIFNAVIHLSRTDYRK